jgi:rifampin ADP-ribosylating transferase
MATSSASTRGPTSDDLPRRRALSSGGTGILAFKRHSRTLAQAAALLPGCRDEDSAAPVCVAAPSRSASIVALSALREPVPFEVYEAGVYLHGTKADLAVGDLLVAGRESNFEGERMMNYIYFTATLDAAVWGAELANGEDRGRIYIVEPTGAFEHDPNVTDKKFPGNPTQSFRSREPLRVVGELVDWVGHAREKLEAMQASLAAMQRNGTAQIED